MVNNQLVIKRSSSTLLVSNKQPAQKRKNLLNQRTSATTISKDEVTNGKLVLFIWLFFQVVVVTNGLSLILAKLSWELAVMFCEFSKLISRAVYNSVAGS